jgi:hypothetical protein
MDWGIQLYKQVSWPQNSRHCGASSDLQEQETLQKLVHPSGLAYDKKKQAFRTIKVNEAFS